MVVDNVIGEGREQDVLALFRPYQLGKDVTAGYRLWNVTIESSAIAIEIRSETGPHPMIHLGPVDEATPEKSASFSIRRDAAASSGDGARAADAVIAAIERNDRGGFWRAPTRAVTPNEARRTSRERSRGIAIPVALTGFFAALLFLLGRRQALTSRPEREPKPPSA